MASSGVTVGLAGGANLVVAVAKLVGGLVSGSSAMLSEAAHSFADTLNQVFLMAALRRSRRPADEQHPFGYGKERYFWSLLAAVAVFVLGAGFSVLQGITALIHPHGERSPMIAFLVLALAFVLDGISLVRAIWQVRREAGPTGRGFVDHLMHHSEPTVRAVFFEDSAGVLGVVLAAAGLGLDVLLGTHVYDAVASIAIGLLLIGVAYLLGQQNRDLLIGQAAEPAMLDGIRAEAEQTPGIRGVIELMTMRLGPEDVLVAARVDVEPETSGDDLELVADEVERRVRASYPDVKHVFVDPTPGQAPTSAGEDDTV